MGHVDAINVLVPAITGLVGILLGGFLAGRNQRNQTHAERMIAAADDLGTSTTAVLDAFYTALSRPHLSRKQMGRVEELLPEARARLTRVVLLFHPDSDTTRAARFAMGQLSVAHYEISLYFNREEEVQRGAEFLRMWDRCNDANTALEEFLREAAQAIRRPGRRRFGQRDSKVEIGAPESGEQRHELTGAQTAETA